MRVFKYRGGNFERDLDSLERNYYWAPKFDDLNDPFETLINTDPFKVQSRTFAKLFGKEKSEQFSEVEKALHNLFDVKKKGIGIYSLSKTFKDELLWAHYADSHRGFCIEYDLELLANSYKSFETFSFPVIYNKKPPEYGIRDINNTKSEQIVQKLAGYKSKRWQYEQEHRIVTGFYGEHPYEPSCLKSIYFGLNMNEKEKELMIDRLKGRNVQFYQIIQKHNSYEFDAVKINDLTKEKYTYLKEIPEEITKGKPINFVINSKLYIRDIKGMVEIELESKVNRKQLDWIAQLLKKDIFRKVERLFVSYTIKDGSKGEGYWAMSTYEKDKLESKINGLTLEQEKSLVNILTNDKRKSLGKWIDETPYVSSGIILVEENKDLFFETIYHDGSKSSTKVTSTKLNGDYRYDDCEPNIHGEYFIVSNDGKLNFCSNDGIFRTIKPFDKNNYLQHRV
ncbi:hypothetical protein C8N26_1408 [Tenacibaculum lutimaris]|uniref:DUF2971 family protein n=1 Tax=Tenacibaculum lutimaris TaxID=285258 RepID=A0A420E0Y9_9FLAO|nr:MULTISPECIES: DUF2971 domain-containing protein [Tenacibaculum]RKF03781.1 hypothetical protein C8N26_1408 [Tenacibaculum lutimaris]